MSFTTDFTKATQAYELNKDIIQKQLNGELYSLELSKNEFNKLFDQHASTDILYKKKNGLMYGIAMRVNFNKNNFNSVTIRYSRANGIKTEYAKTVDAILNKAITSFYGIQIDVDDEYKLIKGIIYNRYDLFNYIENYKEKTIENNLREVWDGNTYLKFCYEDFNKFNIQNKIF